MWNFNNDNIAIIGNDHVITYNMLGNMLLKLSLLFNKRSFIIMLADNSIGSLIGYISCIQSKTVPLVLSSNIGLDELIRYIDIYKPNYLYIPSSYMYDYIGDEVYNNMSYKLLSINKDSIKLNDKLALLLSTSGSTGSLKMVRLSYDNVLFNTKQIVDYLNITSCCRTITNLPMNYTYGLSIINSYLMANASIVLTNLSIMQKDFWNLFKSHMVTSLSGVPYTFEILDKMNFYTFDLPSLKVITQAGGKLSKELNEKFANFSRKKNINFVVMYGQTEASPRMSYLDSYYSIEKLGSIGKALNGGRFELIDDTGCIIQHPYVVGELVYYGRNVSLGYAYNYKDLNDGDHFMSKLFTKDMAYFDDEGFYYIVGRKSRFLKIFGNRINLDEVERFIKDRFNIECACSGNDRILVIFIVDSSYKDLVLDFISNKISIHRSAFRVDIIDEIPKNDAGKILYSYLDISK